MLSDVVESDDDINPNSVICVDELINTLPVNVSKLPALCSNEEVVDSKLLNCMLAEDVYVFNDVVESEEEINPKDVICSEPDIVPLGPTAFN